MANKRQQQLTDTLLKFYQKPVAKASLELFLSIGAVIFFALFAIRPTLVTISDLIKEIEDKEVLLQQLNQKIAALSSAQSNYARLENRIDVLDVAIPPQPNLVEALKIIEKIASEQDIVITSIGVTQVPDENAVESVLPDEVIRRTVPLQIKVQGAFPAVREYITALANVQRSFEVISIEFSKDTERGENKLQTVITLGVVYFGPKAELPRVGGS